MTTVRVTGANRGIGLDLAPQGVAVAPLHPGLAGTDMTGVHGIAAAAAGIVARKDELTLAASGGFWHANGARLPW